jgi:hypothetical protein
MNIDLGKEIATVLAKGDPDAVLDFHYQRPHSVTAKVLRDGVHYTLSIVQDPTQPAAIDAAKAKGKRGRSKVAPVMTSDQLAAADAVDLPRDDEEAPAP